MLTIRRSTVPRVAAAPHLVAQLLLRRILPQGDRLDVPPATGQYSVRALVGLLTIVSVAAAITRLMGGSGDDILLCAVVAGLLWCIAAVKRRASPRPCTHDQQPIRDEVRQWLSERNRQPKRKQDSDRDVIDCP